MKYRLYTENGVLVTPGRLTLPFDQAPDVLTWGMRVFVREHQVMQEMESGQPVYHYREGLHVALLEGRTCEMSS